MILLYSPAQVPVSQGILRTAAVTANTTESQITSGWTINSSYPDTVMETQGRLVIQADGIYNIAISLSVSGSYFQARFYKNGVGGSTFGTSYTLNNQSLVEGDYFYFTIKNTLFGSNSVSNVNFRIDAI